MHRQIAGGDAGDELDQRRQPSMDAVDRILHLLVIAMAFDLDFFPQITTTDLQQNSVALADGKQDGVEHFVGALDHLSIGALEGCRFTALVKLPLAAELGQLGEFGLESLQDLGDSVDVLLHLLVVALIGLSDHLVDLALGDLVENAVAFADGDQDGVEHIVDAVNQVSEPALELLGITAFAQFPLRRGNDQALNFADHFFQIGAQAFDAFVDEHLLAGKHFQRRVEIAQADLLDAGHGLFLDRDMAGDQIVDALGNLGIVAGIRGGGNDHVDIAFVVFRRHVVYVRAQSAKGLAQAVQALEHIGPLALIV